MTLADQQPEDQTEPEPDQEHNFRELEQSRDDWQQRAEAAEKRADAFGQVLDLVGIQRDDDGSFNPNELERWHESTQESKHRARRDLLLEAGFSPDSAEGEVLSMKVDAGEVEADRTAIEAFASQRGWKPNVMLYSGVEHEVVSGSQRLADLNNAAYSEAVDLDTEVDAEIAEARANNDWKRASMLQSKHERRKSR